MSNYRIKIKINDYFPKIDAIPFENYICIISCNNIFSKIKLTEYKYQYFQNNFKLQKNTDLLFNIKLINYLENNTLIGIYDLLLPYTKVNQILQRNNSYYQQQVKLIMNSNVKIKLFGTMMNITSIYLDLIFEISYLENCTSSFPNKINKLRIYDIIGSNSIDNILDKNYNRKLINNNNADINNYDDSMKKRNFLKSPDIYNNNFLEDINYKKLNEQKHYSFNNNIKKNYNCNKNIYNKKHSDINYNVMNNNYLNYFKINNNNYDLNYNIKNNRSPHNSKDFTKSNTIEIINNMAIPEKNVKNYIKINNNKIRERRNENLFNNRYMMNSERINNREIEDDKHLNNDKDENFTEVKSSLDIDLLKNDKKTIDLEQTKKYFIFKENFDNKINNNKLLNYFNYINNNINQNQKKPVLHDKNYYIQKIINNRRIKKIPKSIKNEQNNKEAVKTKKDNYKSKKNLSELNQNNIIKSNLKTPQKIKITHLNFDNDSKNNQTSIFTSNLKNIKDCATELNTIENNKKLGNKIINKINHSLQNSNCKNVKKSFINKKEGKRNNNQNIFHNTNDIDIDDSKNIILRNTNALSDNNNTELNKDDGNLTICTPEDIRDNIIKFIDNYNKYSKEIKEKININKKLFKKLLLCKENYYTELKINNLLENKNNTKNIKYLIHVNIRSKLNEKLYFNMKNIKIKEFKIFEKIFYEHKNSPENKAKEAKRKIQEKLEQQKKVLSLLKIIRELIQKYENLSQVYNDDEKKKILFKSLLVRYGVREKEESKENNLMDKFKEIQNNIEMEKNNNLIKIKNKEIQNDVYKNVIKEESDEERSSISESKLKRGYSLKKKLSWTSEDSIFKDKDLLDSNKTANIDENNNSIVSSGLKTIKENNEEDLLKEKDNNEEKKENESLN